MNIKGPTLGLLLLCLSSFVPAEQIARSSVIEGKPKPVSPKITPKFDPNAKVINVSAALFEVGNQDLKGVSQTKLKQLLEFAVKNGAKDQMSLAVAVESGKTARSSKVRQFRYPTDFDTGKVHPAKSDKAIYSITKGKLSRDTSSYIIPSTAKNFTSANAGYQLEVKPTINPNGSIKLSGKLLETTLLGFNIKETPITMKRSNIAGTRTSTLAIDRKPTPSFHTKEIPLEIASLDKDFYIPLSIKERDTLEADQENTDSMGPKIPIRSPRRALPRTGILVIKAKPDAHQVKIDPLPKDHETGATGKLIYVTSKFIETDKPWNLYSSNFSIGKPVDLLKKLPSTCLLTDPQFQMAIRMLNQQKGVDLLSAPSMMLRDGDQGKMEVIREFIFPQEYETASIETGDDLPFKPVTPIEFDIMNLGVTSLITANLVGAKHINLKLNSTVNEFAGFIDYGQPILEVRSQSLQRNKPFVASENRLLSPVFPTSNAETEITIPDGTTIAFTMIRSEHTQTIEDSGPLGIKRTTQVITKPRYLTMFLKAQIMDPAGQPIN